MNNMDFNDQSQEVSPTPSDTFNAFSFWPQTEDCGRIDVDGTGSNNEIYGMQNNFNHNSARLTDLWLFTRDMEERMMKGVWRPRQANTEKDFVTEIDAEAKYDLSIDDISAVDEGFFSQSGIEKRNEKSLALSNLSSISEDKEETDFKDDEDHLKQFHHLQGGHKKRTISEDSGFHGSFEDLKFNRSAETFDELGDGIEVGIEEPIAPSDELFRDAIRALEHLDLPTSTEDSKRQRYVSFAGQFVLCDEQNLETPRETRDEEIMTAISSLEEDENSQGSSSCSSGMTDIDWDDFDVSFDEQFLRACDSNNNFAFEEDAETEDDEIQIFTDEPPVDDGNIPCPTVEPPEKWILSLVKK